MFETKMLHRGQPRNTSIPIKKEVSRIERCEDSFSFTIGSKCSTQEITFLVEVGVLVFS